MNREEGLRTEIAFWERFLGSDEHKQYPDWARIRDEDEPFYAEWVKWLPEGVSSPFVLDVGSGPVCRIGNLLEKGERARILCSDPLAKEYEALRQRVGITSRAPVTGLNPRECRDHASFAGFDLVIASNSLDHSENPLSVLSDMCYAAKDGANVIVCGYIDEANAANGYGLHQWNMGVKGGGFYVARYGSPSNDVLFVFEGRSIVSAQNWPEKRWFEVVLGPKVKS